MIHIFPPQKKTKSLFPCRQVLIFILFFLPVSLIAQRMVEKNVSMKPDQDIRVEFKFADKIDIKSWDKSEVLVKASVNINDNEDNDAFELTINNTPTSIEFISEIHDMDKLRRPYEETVTRKNGKTVVYSGDRLEMELFFEVFLPQKASLSVKSISGDVEIESYKGELNIETISGFIDLTLNSKEEVDLKMSTVSGEVYTNMDLDIEGRDNDFPYAVSTKVKATLNGGGNEMVLKTVSGDIYLRKL